jgi:hypothetical protein
VKLVNKESRKKIKMTDINKYKSVAVNKPGYEKLAEIKSNTHIPINTLADKAIEMIYEAWEKTGKKYIPSLDEK